MKPLFSEKRQGRNGSFQAHEGRTAAILAAEHVLHSEAAHWGP